MSVKSSNSITTIERLKQEIQQLTDTQIAALERGIYVMMTAEEDRDYDARQRQIAELMNRMMALQRATFTE